ncbi:hypothetical protein IWQ49_006261 [Labrenzia sp. EL_126]|nr:hypothetical protein [Labrenzia sp. EL_126]
MATVKLKGLKITRGRNGSFYVYLRATNERLIEGFTGSREDLNLAMSDPDFLHKYSVKLKKKQAPRKVKVMRGSLAAMIEKYQQKSRWTDLRPRTQKDYQKALDWLHGVIDDENIRVVDYQVSELTTGVLAELRDSAAESRYPKFSNTLLAVLSAAFETGKEYDLAEKNPIVGLRRLYKEGQNKDANRRWTKIEYQTVMRLLAEDPTRKGLRKVIGLGRLAGMRGQDMPTLMHTDIKIVPNLGKAILFDAEKNGEFVPVVVIPELDAILAEGEKTAVTVVTNSLGKPFPTENAMRKAWQDFKAKKTFKTALPESSDLTLHGLRVTYSSELRDLGFANREIADAIGDKSESMGGHYSRHFDRLELAAKIAAKMAR